MIIGFDTETTLFTYGKAPELIMWALQGYEFQQHGQTKEGFERVIRFIWRRIVPYEHVFIVAYNLKFDFVNCIDSLELEDVEKKVLTLNDQPSFATWKREDTGKKLMFVDLANYGLHGTLSSIAKSYGLEKLDIDFGDTTFHDMLVYCYNDAFLCAKILEVINPFNHKAKPQVSMASLSFGDLCYQTGWQPFQRPQFVKEAEREAYFGGWTQAHNDLIRAVRQDPRGYDVLPKNGALYIQGRYYDVNSMYPFVMRDMKVPVGYIGKFTRKNFDYEDGEDAEDILKTIHSSETLTALVRCTVTIKTPSLPVRQEDGSLKFPTGIHHGIWTTAELVPKILNGDVIIHTLAYYLLYEAVKGLFAPWVNHYYEIKKNSDNSITRQQAKLYLNTAYGKFAQRKIVSYELEEILTSKRDIENIKTIAKRKKYAIVDLVEGDRKITVRINGGEISISEKLKEENEGRSTIVGAIITGLARNVLYEVIRKYPVIYNDTDSVIMIKDTSLPSSMIDDKELGFWNLEHECYFDVRDKKDYRCLCKITLKGVPKIDIEGNEVLNDLNYHLGIFHFTRVVQNTEALRREKPRYSLERTSKTLKRKDF